MENIKHEGANPPSKLVRIAIRIDGNGYHFLHELSKEFQDKFSKIETFEIGKSINLLEKSYKIKNIIYFQSDGKMESLSTRGEKIETTFYEVEIRLHLEEQ